MIYNNIKNILNDLQIPFQEISHEASTSCEHSAELRNKAGLEGVGSKNIVFHAKGKFYLVTTLGTKDIKARKFKKEFGTKDIRFASQDEISSLGLGVIGSISSFGIDPELFAQFESRIAEIIENNPEEKDGVQAVVAGELEKTQLGMENAFSNYNREFRSLFSKAANENFFGGIIRKKGTDESKFFLVKYF